MCQLDAIAVSTFPVKHLPSKAKAKEGELKPPAALDLATPIPMSPNFLKLAIDQ